MKVKEAKWLVILVAVAMLVTLVPALGGAEVVYEDHIPWTGQGTDSENCEEYEPGTMHWVLTGATDVIDPVLVLEVDGAIVWSGGPSKTSGPVYHFDTPYYDPENLEATVFFNGTLATNRQAKVTSQFVLSGYCPGEETCVPSGIFGILSTSASGSLAGSIYEIETETNTFAGTQIYQNNASYPHPYGNALALDAENRRLYFTLSTSGSVATDFYFYDFEGNIVTANPTSGWADGKNVCGAAFGDGYYWYIPDGSTSLRKITFNADGTVNKWEHVATLTPAPGGFGDIVYKDGVIYGSTQTRYFTYVIDSDTYITHASVASASNAHNASGINMQLAWGSDGNLYGHSYINKTWWLVTPSTGVSTILYTGTVSYGDLADGFRCD